MGIRKFIHIYNGKRVVYVPLPELWSKCLENYRFEPSKDCLSHETGDWRSHGHASYLLVELSVELEIGYAAVV